MRIELENGLKKHLQFLFRTNLKEIAKLF